MIEIPEETAAKCQKLCRSIVDDSDYEDLKHAILMASPSGENQSDTTALICHGRMLALRDLFDLLTRTARPAAPPPKKKRGERGSGVDPDLDSD